MEVSVNDQIQKPGTSQEIVQKSMVVSPDVPALKVTERLISLFYTSTSSCVYRAINEPALYDAYASTNRHQMIKRTALSKKGSTFSVKTLRLYLIFYKTTGPEVMHAVFVKVPKRRFSSRLQPALRKLVQSTICSSNSNISSHEFE